MRGLAAVVLILLGCSGESPAPAADDAGDQPPVITVTAPLSDLHFNDDQLQQIAVKLIEEARLRGIDAVPGQNRVERLLWLEGQLGNSSHALARTNALVTQMTATDASQWGKLRQQAAREFGTRDDEVAKRVIDLLTRWQQRKSESVFRYLSSNYKTTYITSWNWEQRFHDFVAERPVDAATWGWLLLRIHAADAQKQYGRADSESAYRFYLEFSGLGNGREAREIFSVPGVEISDAH
ncbi:MAG TPA: hypothetical protein VF883_15775 [Thermoanaerobaculia bacterium]|jgi:hypothetical protein